LVRTGRVDPARAGKAVSERTDKAVAKEWRAEDSDRREI
jgi:hypothetical protein